MIQQIKTHLGKTTAAAIILVLIAAQSGCSKSASDKISIGIVPSRPVVIAANFQIPDPTTVGTGTVTYIPVVGPWLRFSYNVANNYDPATNAAADKAVTIVGIQADVTGFTITGQQVYAPPIALSVSDASGYVAASSNPFLAYVPPGGTISAGGTFNGTTYTGNFYLQSLPSLLGTSAPNGNASPTPSPIINNYNYQVRLTFTGWFGTYDAPQGRFTKVITISSQ